MGGGILRERPDGRPHGTRGSYWVPEDGGGRLRIGRVRGV
jgi:hypothetical protein